MPSERRVLRCAVYTRKSSEHGLEQDFNSLDAQREAGEAYIKSQSHEGWKLIRAPYADGGLSGATMERPALQRLLADIAARLIDVVVVYKVDRLTRSLADFAKLIETFEAHGVSFVSVTQQFNTTVGQSISVGVGLLVERHATPYTGLVTFIVCYFAMFWVAWRFAVRVTEPRAHVRERGEPSAVLLGAYAAADDLWTQSTVLL